MDGVYTSDPRIVPNARKLPEISYDEMLELAALGSKVMQARSVEFAKKFGVVFEVRSSFNDNPGTIVKEETAKMEDVVIRGVAVDKNQAKVTIAACRQTRHRREDLQDHRRREHQHRRHRPKRQPESRFTDISFTVGYKPEVDQGSATPSAS